MFQMEVVDHNYLGECKFDPTFKKNDFMTEITEAIRTEIKDRFTSSSKALNKQSCCAVYSSQMMLWKHTELHQDDPGELAYTVPGMSPVRISAWMEPDSHGYPQSLP
jgi:hypothetical protein